MVNEPKPVTMYRQPAQQPPSMGGMGSAIMQSFAVGAGVSLAFGLVSCRVRPTSKSTMFAHAPSRRCWSCGLRMRRFRLSRLEVLKDGQSLEYLKSFEVLTENS